VIKYLGSKRALLPTLEVALDVLQPASALDMFSGSGRVSHLFKQHGAHVTSVDSARYAWLFAHTMIETDARTINQTTLAAIIDELNALPGLEGYFTETFCRDARFFHPDNGQRVDAIRIHINTHYKDTPLHPLLTTALILACDKVDSTLGQQMAYLKQWAPRALKPLTLTVPPLLPGPGRAIHADALTIAMPRTQLAYLDPPYNQHSYLRNYHVYETLARGDEPATYGMANKRLDLQGPQGRSPFNSKRESATAIRESILKANAETTIVSFSTDAWATPELVSTALYEAGHTQVEILTQPHRRHVSSLLGQHGPEGRREGLQPARTATTEQLFIGGTPATVQALRAALLARTGVTAHAA
jgi:adenine-specific DNA-methyltransferase